MCSHLGSVVRLAVKPLTIGPRSKITLLQFTYRLPPVPYLSSMATSSTPLAKAPALSQSSTASGTEWTPKAAAWRLQRPRGQSDGSNGKPPAKKANIMDLDDPDDLGMGSDKDRQEDQKYNGPNHLDTIYRTLNNHSQQLRAISGVLYTTYIVPSGEKGSGIVKASLQEGILYDQNVKAAGPGHKLGSPHLHVAAAALGAAAQVKTTELDQLLLQNLVEHFSKQSDQKHIGDLFLFIKCKETYSTRNKKNNNEKSEAIFTFALDMISMVEIKFKDKWFVGPSLAYHTKKALVAALTMDKAVKKPGSPPKDELERIITRRLKNTKNNNKI